MGFKERYNAAWSDDSLRLTGTPSTFAKESLFYVQEIGCFRTLSSYFTERECLDSFLMVYTTGGKGKLNYKDKTYAIDFNQFFFIDCMNYHYYCTDPSEHWELLWVHFNGSTSRGYYNKFAEERGTVLKLSSESNIPLWMKQLIQLHQKKSLYSEVMSSKLLVSLLTECLLEQENKFIPTSGTPDYIEGMIQEISQRFNDKITLDQLAEQFSISKYHLAKQFKRSTGFSPNEYLIHLRITKAKELLKYTTMPIAQIASEVGIDHVSHFINLFKERVDHTPLIYRKKWQQLS